MDAKPIPSNLTPPTDIQGAKPHANLVFTKGLPKCYPTVNRGADQEVLIPHTTLKTDHSTDKNLGATRLVNNVDPTISAPTN